IQVASEPPGARVSIDNAYLGVTPLLSGTLLAGTHAVRVEADGRFPWMSRVDVRPGGERLPGRAVPAPTERLDPGPGGRRPGSEAPPGPGGQRVVRVGGRAGSHLALLLHPLPRRRLWT